MQYLKPDSVTPSALTCWMYGSLCVMGSLIKTFVKAVYNEEGLSKGEMEIYFVLLLRDCGKKVAKERKYSAHLSWSLDWLSPPVQAAKNVIRWACGQFFQYFYKTHRDQIHEDIYSVEKFPSSQIVSITACISSPHLAAVVPRRCLSAPALLLLPPCAPEALRGPDEILNSYWLTLLTPQALWNWSFQLTRAMTLSKVFHSCPSSSLCFQNGRSGDDVLES